MDIKAKILAELVGTALLLIVVVGSGIAGESFAAGNAAVALLANSIATGAGLYVLITLLGPISGAHFNPAVTLHACATGLLDRSAGAAYVAAQFAGGIVGVWVTHAMYALPVIQLSAHIRSGPAQWLSEVLATALLLGSIHLGVRHAKEKIPLIVALLVSGGYWFTASTFFANPAVTLARALTDSFAGIRPQDVFGFMLAQCVGATFVLSMVWRFGAATRPAEEESM